MRIDGEIVRLEGYENIENDVMEAMLRAIMPGRSRQEFADTNDTDFAYELEGLARFRCNALRERRGAAACSVSSPRKSSPSSSSASPPELQQLCHLNKGLVLVTGPTGSGKSTTLCAMIDLVNRVRKDHVITIEDPIEFVHRNKQCMITQRQVGQHTTSFKSALRAALREDPDIILVGELRDLETVSIAIETAETGHLVFGTLHTSTAASTVDRVIDQFAADRQEQIRVMLSESLKGVIAQTLCAKIGGGRVAAREVLLSVPAISQPDPGREDVPDPVRDPDLAAPGDDHAHRRPDRAGRREHRRGAGGLRQGPRQDEHRDAAQEPRTRCELRRKP